MADRIEVGMNQIQSDETSTTYPIAWVNRLSAQISRLPIPYVLAYFTIGLLLLGVQCLIQWRDGTYPMGTFLPFHVYFAFATPYFLALIHYLDKTADIMLEDIEPLLHASTAEVAQIRHELTKLPAHRALLAGLVGIALGAILGLNYPWPQQLALLNVSDSSASIAFNLIIYAINWAATATATYHALHQLRRLNRILNNHVRVDIYHTSRFYAISGLSARAAVGLALGIYGGLITPHFIVTPFWILQTMLFSLVILAGFLSPLLGVHRRLSRERSRALSVNADQIKAITRELHDRVERKDLAGMNDLNLAMTTLEMERKSLRAISTWPWHTGTISTVGAAVLFPVIVWFLQWLLRQLLET